MTDKPEPDDIPALFATIHHQSSERPGGYTAEDIAELNRLANRRKDRGSRRDKAIWIVGIVTAISLAGVAAGTLASPLWVPGQITSAAEAGNRSRLEQLVDFRTVKTALEADLKELMSGEYRRQMVQPENGIALMFSGIGMGLVESSAATMAEQIVTPIALEKAATGQDVFVDQYGDHTLLLPEFRHVKGGLPGFTVRGKYLSFSRYEYRLQSLDSDRAFDVEMRRTGLFTWQISRVKIDPSYLSSEPVQPLPTTAASTPIVPPVDPAQVPVETADHDADRLTALYQRSDCGELVGLDRGGCFEEEYIGQDRQLNVEYRSLQANLSANGRSQLLTSQRAWLKSRDIKCAAELADYGGPPGHWIETACLAQETARRRLFLQDFPRS